MTRRVRCMRRLPVVEIRRLHRAVGIAAVGMAGAAVPDIVAAILVAVRAAADVLSPSLIPFMVREERR